MMKLKTLRNRTDIELRDVERGDYSEVIKQISNTYHLTRREEQVLLVIVLFGYSNQKLADFFYVSERTIKNHVSNLFKKTASKSTRELMALVVQYILQQEKLYYSKKIKAG
jgi:DNA-binding CsgD family transcriptional regulator